MYSPRIYTYKITFEEVPYYYYGIHEEKVYDEEYWGSPITNKWCWELYTPKKQILETFSSREDAAKIERRLIKPVYNTDKWCLNANCGGFFSLDTCSKAGKIGGSVTGKKHRENNTGIFSLTSEQRSKFGKMGGIVNVETGHIQQLGKKTLRENIEKRKGIFAYNAEQKSEVGRKGGEKSYLLKKGCFSLTEEERKEVSKKAGKKVAAQRWKCLVTGHISTPGGLSNYQNYRGIDTSLRIRIN